MIEKEVFIYTDGACLGNPGRGGYGVVLCYNGNQRQLSGGFRLTTNNRMEVMAAIVGLEALKPPCTVTLYTDSRYLADAITKGWARRWRAKGWWRTDKEKALNADLWSKLLKLCEQHTVKFRWIKGHAGHEWNEICDKLSKESASALNLPDDDGYTAKPRTGVEKASSPQCVQFNGKNYTWDSANWYDTETHLKPPVSVISELNKCLVPLLEEEDQQIENPHELLKRAKKARDSSQYVRAEELARRAVRLSPNNAGALAVLSSCLRTLGRPQEALRETDRFEFTRYAPLLNTRVAALCDLDRWEEAKIVVDRALGNEMDKEKFSEIVNRIKAAKPELYSE